MSKKAFTLVELAIVISLIALVIAAISAGDKLAQQAALKKLIFDINKLEIAYSEFVVQYDEIPGDTPNGAVLFSTGCTSSAACNGNGDGQIDFNSTSSTDETAAALRMLNLANLIESGGEIQVGSHAPNSDLGKPDYFPQTINESGLAIIGSSDANSNRICSSGGNNIVHLFQDTRNNAVYLIKSIGTDWCYGGITPLEAYQLDKKIDDGRTSGGNAIGASTGKFRASIDKSNDPCVSGDVYETDTPDESCIIAREIKN